MDELKEIKQLKQEIADLKSDIKIEKMNFECLYELYVKEKEKVVRLKHKLIGSFQGREAVKRDAYKEFADRLEEKLKGMYLYDDFKVRCLGIHIEKLLKEMGVDENNDQT